MITRLFEALANHRNSDRPTRILSALLYTFNIAMFARSVWIESFIGAGMFAALTVLFVWMDSEKHRRIETP